MTEYLRSPLQGVTVEIEKKFKRSSFEMWEANPGKGKKMESPQGQKESGVGRPWTLTHEGGEWEEIAADVGGGESGACRSWGGAA